MITEEKTRADCYTCIPIAIPLNCNMKENFKNLKIMLNICVRHVII